VTDNGKREPLRSAHPLVSAMLPSFKYPRHHQFPKLLGKGTA
jgi:hypothetical protein